VFNVTFNNLSVISWWSVLLVEQTGVTGENHWPGACHWQTLSHNVLSHTPRHENTISSKNKKKYSYNTCEISEMYICYIIHMYYWNYTFCTRSCLPTKQTNLN